MGYFRELPNLEYQNFLSDSISSQSYLEVKNLFRRNKIRDDLQDVFTLFDKYEIREGARPDTIAEEIYGDAELDWVVLITAGIINVRNEWPLSDSISSQNYLEVKNLFRRNKIRDDLQNVFTLFDKYQIREGARPDTIAEEIYGDAELDWVVLITAGIINVRDEWPLSDRDLYYFVENKYGISDYEKTRHYETKEVKDSLGRLILPAGKVVDKNFTMTYYDSKLANNVTTASTDIQGITNYEYEVDLNNKKRGIYLLKRMYLQQFLNDMRDIMIYQQSSERINDRLIRTENTRVTMPT